jgi:hypothetical protein
MSVCTSSPYRQATAVAQGGPAALGDSSRLELVLAEYFVLWWSLLRLVVAASNGFTFEVGLAATTAAVAVAAIANTH